MWKSADLTRKKKEKKGLKGILKTKEEETSGTGGGMEDREFEEKEKEEDETKKENKIGELHKDYQLVNEKDTFLDSFALRTQEEVKDPAPLLAVHSQHGKWC